MIHNELNLNRISFFGEVLFRLKHIFVNDFDFFSPNYDYLFETIY